MQSGMIFLESSSRSSSLFEHDLFPKTGSHPASSAGQAFSGSCSKVARAGKTTRCANLVSFRIGKKKRLTFTFILSNRLRDGAVSPSDRGKAPDRVEVRVDPVGGIMTDISLGPSARLVRLATVRSSAGMNRFSPPRVRRPLGLNDAGGLRSERRTPQGEFPRGFVDFLLGRGPRQPR